MRGPHDLAYWLVVIVLLVLLVAVVFAVVPNL